MLDQTNNDENRTQPLKLSPSEVRKSANLSQNMLARQAELSVNAIQNIEQKRRLLYTSATKILSIINAHRITLELPPLELEDIDWTIR